MTAKKGSRKSTTARKTTKKTQNSKNAKTQIDTNDNGLWDEVLLLILVAFSILLLLSNFHLVGSFGEWISQILFGLFGIMAYVAPLLLFVGACFIIANRGNVIAKVKIYASIFLFIGFCTLTHLIIIKEVKASGLSAYTYGTEKRNGGGLLGGTLANLLSGAIGTVGTYLILLVLAIICFVLITEKSFVKGVKNQSEKVYHNAKEDAKRRKEIREERMQQRREEEEQQELEREQALRMNKKVTGVAMNTSIQKTRENNASDMHEINMPEEILPPEKEQLPVNPEPVKQIVPEPVAEPIPSMTLEKLNQEEFDFESIQIKMADSFAEEARLEAQYVLPDAVEIKAECEEMSLVEKPSAVLRESEKVCTVEKKEEKDITEELSKPDHIKPRKEYKFPPVDLLTRGKVGNSDSRKELQETAMKLQQTLASFGVRVTMTEISQGPTVTRYEMQPEQGVKVSKIVNLADDIKLNLAAADIRIEAPIPGKAAIGIEVPNKDNSVVMFRDLIDNDKFSKFPSNLAFAVGKGISGEVIVTDIAKMPHLLIAGATGSGKSVCINTLIMSIIYKSHPDDVKMIMVDPKVVELSVYNGIPHLMVPVVTDPKKAAAALHWGVAEMTDRYQKFADFNVRDLKGYNKKIEEMSSTDENLKKLPQIVIIVDELADLMMVSPGEVEESICRLAQLARAAGIHLVIATQRPSVDVITGLIKANMPSRIAFSVSSGVDSRTILDMNGAEKLLGKGDMLFYPQGFSKPARVQGAFISDKEVQNVVDFLKDGSDGVSYSQEVEEKISSVQVSGGLAGGTDAMDEKDMYFVDAGKFIIEKDKASIGMLQRVFKIGFNRAARIMDQLSEAGVVGEEEGTKPRKVLMSEEQFETYIDEYL